MRRYQDIKPSFYEMASLQGFWRHHPRYDGCVLHWMFNEYGGDAVFDWSDHNYKGSFSATSPTWVIGRGGIGVQMISGSTISTSSANAEIQGRPGMSSVMLFDTINGVNDTGGSAVVARQQGAGNDNFRHRWQANELLDLEIYNNSNVANGTLRATVTEAGLFSQITTFDGANVYNYCRNLSPGGTIDEIASVSHTGTTQSGVTNVVEFDYSDLIHHDFRLYDRALTEEEALSYHDNPYLEFEWARERLQRRIFVLGGSAPGGDQTISVTETGSGVDTPDIAASFNLAETASGSDSFPIGATVPMSDAGSGADTSTIAAALLVALVGAGVENLSIQVGTSLGDTGSGSESTPISASLVLTDTGTGADSVSILIGGVLKSVTDTLTGTDTVASIAVSFTLAESATGVFGLVVQVSLSELDTGSGTDAVDVAAVATILETAVGTDAESTPIINVNVTESPSGTDQIDITAALSVLDTGSGVDAVTVTTSIIKTVLESGSGVDSVSLTATISPTDTASAVESLAAIVSALVAETGAGVEVVTQTVGGGQLIAKITLRVGR